jgi:hypothetical protein
MYTTEKEIQDRIDVIDLEAKEIRVLKSFNRNIEWNYLINELQEERDFLIQKRNKFHLMEADYWDGDESDNFLQ